MKKLIAAVFVFYCTLFLTIDVWGEEKLLPEFQQIRSLIGHWQGTLPDGKPIDISYQEISGGAILEIYHSTDPMWWNMSSVYHADVDKVIMSHYCSWGNHPRMTASVDSSTAKQLQFSFLDVTETQPSHGYMRDATIFIDDENNFRHQWIWYEDGERTPLMLYMTRKK